MNPPIYPGLPPGKGYLGSLQVIRDPLGLLERSRSPERGVPSHIALDCNTTVYTPPLSGLETTPCEGENVITAPELSFILEIGVGPAQILCMVHDR